MLMHFLYRRMVKIVASVEVKQDMFNGLIKTKCFRLIKIKYISLKRIFSEFKFCKKYQNTTFLLQHRHVLDRKNI